jgi:hypothetical protein
VKRPRFVASRRAQPVNPQAVLSFIGDHLHELARLFEAISFLVEDQRWLDCAKVLDEAAHKVGVRPTRLPW